MAEVPASFGLKKKVINKHAYLIGKDDTGKDYVARRCSGSEVTETDIKELAANDRQQTTAKEATKRLVDWIQEPKKRQEQKFEEELMEAAGPVVRAGLGREGSVSRYSRAYRENFDRVFGGTR